ncbi:MAG TPA: hypothetical protein VHC22_17030 [Pirellulales bacterium]|nr:hypothetical protein [Pirellulales bacterium]
MLPVPVKAGRATAAPRKLGQRSTEIIGRRPTLATNGPTAGVLPLPTARTKTGRITAGRNDDPAGRHRSTVGRTRWTMHAEATTIVALLLRRGPIEDMEIGSTEIGGMQTATVQAATMQTVSEWTEHTGMPTATGPLRRRTPTVSTETGHTRTGIGRIGNMPIGRRLTVSGLLSIDRTADRRHAETRPVTSRRCATSARRPPDPFRDAAIEIGVTTSTIVVHRHGMSAAVRHPVIATAGSVITAGPMGTAAKNTATTPTSRHRTARPPASAHQIGVHRLRIETVAMKTTPTGTIADHPLRGTLTRGIRTIVMIRPLHHTTVTAISFGRILTRCVTLCGPATMQHHRGRAFLFCYRSRPSHPLTGAGKAPQLVGATNRPA